MQSLLPTKNPFLGKFLEYTNYYLRNEGKFNIDSIYSNYLHILKVIIIKNK